MKDDNLLWQVRHFVYAHFAETTRPPSVDETAAHFNISTEEAGKFYKELHNRHSFFLEPETLKGYNDFNERLFESYIKEYTRSYSGGR